MSTSLSQAYTQERLKLVLDSTRLGMWDWNPQTNEVVFDANWAEMLGLTLDDLDMTLEDWSSRVHPDDMDGCFQDIQAHIDGKADFYENLHRMKHADGHWVYILDRGRVVERDQAGNAIRFTGTHSDLTPLKNAEFQASVALKERERFFSSMSHELRAPIHAMLGIVELVAQEIKQPHLKSQLSIVEDSGQHLLLIIKDILDSAKLQESNIELSPSVFSISDMVQYILDLYATRASQKSIRLAADELFLSDDVFIETDRSRLVQILINLVSNAIKYTEQGQVTIALSHEPEHLCLHVQDTGAGIENTDAIFNAYVQEQSGRFDDVNSTGLGLHICKELSRLLEFELTLESELDKGSTFTIRIPIALKREAPDEQLVHAHEAIDPAKWPHKTILIVDDTPVNIMLTAGMLKPTPLTILVAKNGEEALSVLNEESVDIILTDLHMPKMGGSRLTYAVRHDEALEQPRIIGQSADAQEAVRQKCLEVGMDDYLQKPFNQQQLWRAIDHFLKA